tara:strand:+ start:2352 stop:2918 length:567 start_codon:yes stop_codon:yes gene_type:complete
MATEYLNNKDLETVIKKFQKAKRERVKLQFIIEDLELSRERILERRGKKNALIEDLMNYNLGVQNCITTDYTTSQGALATNFYTLSENLANFWQSRAGGKSYFDIDDAIQEGVLICFEKIDRFDPDKGKAFNYLTTCVFNHFRQLYRSAKHYNELKMKYSDFIQSQLHPALKQPKKPSNHQKYKDDYR